MTVLFSALGAAPSSSRAQKMDSLNQLLVKAEGLERGGLLIGLFELLPNQNSDSAFQVAHEILRLGHTLGVDTLIGWGHYNLGSSYWYGGEFDSAGYHIQKSIDFRTHAQHREKLGQSLNVMGVLYDMWGKTDSALAIYAQALEHQRAVGDKEGESATLNNIAYIYQSQGNNEEALRYMFKVLEIENQRGEEDDISTTYSNIASTYNSMGFYDKALKNHKKALEIRKKTGNKLSIARSLNNIALTYEDMGKFAEAEESLQEALALKREADNGYEIAATLRNIGKMMVDQGRHEESLPYLFEAKSIGDTSNFSQIVLDLLDIIGDAYAGLEDYENAYRYGGLYRNMQDSLQIYRKDEKMVELLEQFNSMQQQLELDSLRYEQRLQAQDLDAAERQTNYLLVFSAIVGLLAIGMFVMFLQKQGANRKLLILNQKLEERNRQIKDKNDEIQETSALLARKNSEVLEINQNLETIVGERTRVLMETNEELDTFLYQTSHALRAPLMRIIGLFDLARTATQVDVQQEMFERIHGTIHGMDRMLFKLLEVQEIKLRALEPARVDCSQLVQEITSELEAHSDLARPEMELDLPAGKINVPDRPILRVIVANLLENAWHFRQEGASDHTIWLKMRASAGQLSIEIRDNGMGIPEAELALVFQMFHRATYKSEGSGLGLYVIAKALERLGGEAKLESQEGEYTQFSLEIPTGGPVEPA